MMLYPRQSIALITAMAVLSFTTRVQAAEATEPHIVNLSELKRDISSVQRARAQNLADIERVISLPQAQEALAKSHVNTATVRAVIADLNDQELSRLADRARVAEKEVEGGLIVGLLALIGLIVVIIIVVALVKK